MCNDIEKIFSMTKFIVDLKIEVTPLQQSPNVWFSFIKLFY